ncbi:MAG: anthranilate synthase component I family protein [Planctomycetota bacterium]|jgi:para-aminobenzoate synthetase component 1
MIPLDSLTPLDVIRCWPRGRRLAGLVSAGFHPRWARWSVIGEPAESIEVPPDPERVGEALGELDACHRLAESQETIFSRGWIVELRYELARVFEPTSLGRAIDEPVMVLHRCPGALVYDHLESRWHRMGSMRVPEFRQQSGADHAGLASGRSLAGAEEYGRAVERALEYISAGDAYQANVSHAITGEIVGSWRELASTKLAALCPWYGAYIETSPGRATLSCSPELLIEHNSRTRSVTTRPIKGTRASSVDPGILRRSDKDGAELAMIVDLMRNDLGRVCQAGTIHVASHRDIEHHGYDASRGQQGVWHSVSTVEGTLGRGASLSDLLRACFPAGSITGAPKIRAMQIIEELESRTRGAYCGSVGFVSETGHAAFNVGIRTATLRAGCGARRDGTFEYPVGAGIVAQSEPASEWEETLHKAAGMMEGVAPSPENECDEAPSFF